MTDPNQLLDEELRHIFKGYHVITTDRLYHHEQDKCDQLIGTVKAKILAKFISKDEVRAAIQRLKNPYPTHKGRIVKDWDAIHHAWEVCRGQIMDELGLE